MDELPQCRCASHAQISGVRPQSQHQLRAARPAPLLTESTDRREDVSSNRPGVDDEQRQTPSDPAGAMRLDSGSRRRRKEELRLRQLKQLSNSRFSLLLRLSARVLLVNTDFRRTGRRAQQPWLRSQHRARTPVSLLEATAVRAATSVSSKVLLLGLCLCADAQGRAEPAPTAWRDPCAARQPFPCLPQSPSEGRGLACAALHLLSSASLFGTRRSATT